MRSRLIPVALSLALLPAAPALADDLAPDALMRRVTQEVVDSTNYRSAFADEVRNHGIDGLISTLASKNRG